MKLTATTATLLAALTNLSGVVASRTSLPILSNVRIVVLNGRATLTTSDLDRAMSRTFDVTDSEDGAFTLPAKRLLSIAKVLTKGDVTLTLDGSVVRIVAGPSKFKLNGLPAEEFPADVLPQGTSFTVPARVLRDAFTHTVFATSTDETRYVLQGCLFDFEGTSLFIVGTDGRRMSVATVALETPLKGGNLIVPTAAVNDIIPLLDIEEAVTVTFSDSGISFATGNSILVTKVIEGNYPNYQQVIPTANDLAVVVNRADFAAAVARMGLVEGRNEGVLNLTLCKGEIILNSIGAEVGEADEIVSAAYEGPKVSVSFNPAFLLAPLKHVKDETVTLYFGDNARSPMMLRAPFTHVLMPRASNAEAAKAATVPANATPVAEPTVVAAAA